MSTPQREFVLAVRVPRNHVEELDRLVEGGVYDSRSAALRQAILNLLSQKRLSEIRIAEPIVNRANEDDNISRLVKEGFSLKSK